MIPRRFALAAVAASAFAAARRPVRAQAPDAIRVVSVMAEDLTDLYYGIKTGMFARAGLDVTLAGNSSGSASTTAMIAGAADVARSSLLALISAYLRGIPVALVAPSIVSTQRTANVLLQIPADSTVRTAADLTGKTIAVPGIADLNSLSIRAWVDKNGGDWHSLKYLEVPNAAIEAALVQHRVDAAMMQSPQLDNSLAAGTTKTLAYSHGAIAPIFMSAAYAARRDWIAQHGTALRRFNAVLNEARDYVTNHQNETLPLVVELTKVQIAPGEKVHRTRNAAALDPALVQPVIDGAARYELTPRAFPAREFMWSA
jgi:NitT/TauT family transport system substrate-binding protein